MRYELTDFEWAAIRPFLPNKPHGVPRVNDRRVLNGIFSILQALHGAICRTRSQSLDSFELCKKEAWLQMRGAICSG
jgi:hypothetical protein